MKLHFSLLEEDEMSNAKLWEYLDPTIVTRSVITVVLVIGLVYMYLNQIPVPDNMISISMLILGYWFGHETGKVLAEVQAARNGKVSNGN